MVMFCQYGAHKHLPGEVEYSIRKDAVYSDAGTPKSQIWTLNATGTLIADGSKAIDRKVAEIISAYAHPGKDWRVVIDAGGGLQESQHSLQSRDTLGGIRITQTPSFPSNRDGAYANYLIYTFALEAEIPVVDPQTLLNSFEERLSFSGGGPRFGILEPNIGLPVVQRLKAATAYTATQEGRAVGMYRYPSVPRAIWPSAQITRPSITKSSPRRQGFGRNTTLTDFAVTWRYEFASPFPMYGTPHNWGTM